MSNTPLAEYNFGHVIVRRWSKNYMDSLFENGAVCPAEFRFYPGDYALAEQLGYGNDVEAMHASHDVCHHYLSVAMGKSWSPTLYCVAMHNKDGSPYCEDWWREETLVKAFQRWMNTHEWNPALSTLALDTGKSLPGLAQELREIVEKLKILENR